MERILITGGSGFIGTNMVDYYISKNIEICNVDIVSPLNKAQKNKWVNCDINQESKLMNVITDFNPNYIIHLAAGTGMNVSDISHFRTNFDGVKSLINASNSLNNLKKIIFTSSLLVCERTHVPKNDIDFKPDSLYGESKVLSEKIVRDSNINSEWTIIRPTAVWGPWFRSSYTSFFKLINKGLYVNPGKKRLKKPATYVGNTIYMIDKIMRSNKSHGNVYYLADYPEYSIQEWANSIANNLFIKKPMTFPISIIYFIAKFGDILKLLKLNSDPPISTFRLNNILSSAEYNIGRTKNIVGTLPYDLDSGVRLTIDWMKNKSNLKIKE